MSTVVMHNVVSVDGFIADEHDDVGPLFEFYSNGDVDLYDFARVTPASADYLRTSLDSIGALVIGRHLFDITNGWEGEPPAGIGHVVVVSHRPRPEGWHPAASYHFVDGVAEAIARAQEVAEGARSVGVAAGVVGGQALALGLVDEVAMDLVPVVFGTGKRYFGAVDAQHLLEDPHVVVQGSRVLHLRYRVRR